MLTYTNTNVQFLLKKHRQSVWWKRKDPEAWGAREEEIKKELKRTLMFEDEGGVWIRPGFLPYLEGRLNIEIDNKIFYPTPKPIPWYNAPAVELYPYQKQSTEKLIQIRHGNVELCTGAGKSLIILSLCRETGFRTAIVAPSQSIFNELVEKFEHHFGPGAVGKFGDGKKIIGRRFTVCIGDSLCNVKEGSTEWEFFSKLDMVCVDESHTWGSKTLEDVCHGVMANVPYRCFFSGTQVRNSGDTILLQSIIGKTVHVLSTSEAVGGGYICPHEYKIISVFSSRPDYKSKDPITEKRQHLLYNKNIAEFSAKLANAEAVLNKKQTLILVEELEQIASLLPLITVPVAIAHSEKNSEKLSKFGLPMVDPKESVEKFNKAEALVLIGTSCISTGTNIFANHITINWVGGSSPIKTLQGAVGRSVRMYKNNPWRDRCVPKDKCVIIDFDVVGIETMERHLDIRIELYKKSGSEIKHVTVKK